MHQETTAHRAKPLPHLTMRRCAMDQCSQEAAGHHRVGSVFTTSRPMSMSQRRIATIVNSMISQHWTIWITSYAVTTPVNLPVWISE